MSNLDSPRGVHDLIGLEFQRHKQVLSVARSAANLYAFQEIETPIFEYTEIFSRTLGENSDAVSKEMYSFEDKKGKSLTLRPELTAPNVRVVASSELRQSIPLRLFSCGPVFRYERPQTGRRRQFHQINFEVFGVSGYQMDVEIILLALRLLRDLGIDQKVNLQINSLGDASIMSLYARELHDYLSRHISLLSDDSKLRLSKNPLRILDSKDESDRAILMNAPKIYDYYSADARNRFDNVLSELDRYNVEYLINPYLVRGLDYYSHTVFEFVMNSDGSQNAVLAGGRYDSLFKMMDGKLDVPAMGFAAGIERIANLISLQEKNISTYITILPMQSDYVARSLQISEMIRDIGIKSEVIYTGNLKKKMYRASRMNVTHWIVIGADEHNSQEYTIKDLKLGTEIKCCHDNVRDIIKEL